MALLHRVAGADVHPLDRAAARAKQHLERTGQDARGRHRLRHVTAPDRDGGRGRREHRRDRARALKAEIAGSADAGEREQYNKKKIKNFPHRLV
jgi:hypothetical protein